MKFPQIREKEFTAFPVRALLATLFSVCISIGFFRGIVDTKDYKEIVMLALVWYFTKRNENDQVATISNRNKQDASNSAVVTYPLPNKHAEVNVHASVDPAGTGTASLSGDQQSHIDIHPKE